MLLLQCLGRILLLFQFDQQFLHFRFQSTDVFLMALFHGCGCTLLFVFQLHFQLCVFFIGLMQLTGVFFFQVDQKRIVRFLLH